MAAAWPFNSPATHLEHGTSVYARLFPSASDNKIAWERNGAGQDLLEVWFTTFVVEWGSQWQVQQVTVDGAKGGNGVNSVGEYTTATIDSVRRENTWLWATGHRSDGGIGDCAEAVVVTLGDGVNQNDTETSVAVGSEYTDQYHFDVYAMTHPDLQVDHVFKVDGDQNVLDKALIMPDTATDGQRFAWSYNTLNGTGTAFPRPRMWAHYLDNATVQLSRGYDGQAYAAWVQGIDFSRIEFFNDVDGDGLPDFWEQQIVDARLDDSIGILADVLPEDDFDQDGLTNAQEYSLGTDVTDADSDGDGFDDFYEFRLGTSPIGLDTDGDGLIDSEEARYGSDVHSVDSDGDGIWDGYEVSVLGTHPLLLDSDGDGIPDNQEESFRDPSSEVPLPPEGVNTPVLLSSLSANNLVALSEATEEGLIFDDFDGQDQGGHWEGPYGNGGFDAIRSDPLNSSNNTRYFQSNSRTGGWGSIILNDNFGTLDIGAFDTLSYRVYSDTQSSTQSIAIKVYFEENGSSGEWVQNLNTRVTLSDVYQEWHEISVPLEITAFQKDGGNSDLFDLSNLTGIGIIVYGADGGTIYVDDIRFNPPPDAEINISQDKIIIPNQADQEVTLTARVTQNDQAAANQVVTFSENGSGTLSANQATTNANGEATVIYRAGNAVEIVTITASSSNLGAATTAHIQQSIIENYEQTSLNGDTSSLGGELSFVTDQGSRVTRFEVDFDTRSFALIQRSLSQTVDARDFSALIYRLRSETATQVQVGVELNLGSSTNTDSIWVQRLPVIPTPHYQEIRLPLNEEAWVRKLGNGDFDLSHLETIKVIFYQNNQAGNQTFYLDDLQFVYQDLFIEVPDRVFTEAHFAIKVRGFGDAASGSVVLSDNQGIFNLPQGPIHLQEGETTIWLSVKDGIASGSHSTLQVALSSDAGIKVSAPITVSNGAGAEDEYGFILGQRLDHSGLIVNEYQGENLVSHLYNNALSSVVFTHKGTQESLAYTRDIFDTINGFQYTVDSDPHPRQGEIDALGLSITGAFPDAFLSEAPAAEPYDASEGTIRHGNNSWYLLALGYYTQATGDTQYVPVIEELADYLIGTAQNNDPESPTYGAVLFGFDGVGGNPSVWRTNIATEHQTEAFSGLLYAAEATNDSAKSTAYLQAAHRILTFALNVLYQPNPARGVPILLGRCEK